MLGTFRAVLLGTLAAAGLAAGTAQAETLRIAMNADIRSTDPGVNRDENTDTVVLHIVEGLVGYDEQGQPKPLLAEKIALSDDGRTYTFTLRDGVKFHNGAALTAADVVAAWKRYMTPALKWRCLSQFDGSGQTRIESVEAADPRTVVFHISAPSALFLSTMARPDCGGSGIYHADSLNADGSWNKPIGTGPYALAEWKQGRYVELKRFDGYSALSGPADGYVGDKTPKVDTARFVIIPDPAAARAALLAGDIEIVSDVSASDYKELQGNPAVTTASSPAMGISGLLLQTRDPLLKNPDLRLAIATALDIPALVDAVSEGLAEPNNSIVPLASPFYGAVEKRGFTHDPAKVKDLLAKAGYKGETIVMLANQRYKSMYDTAVLAQAMLQAAGINVDLSVMEWGAQLDKYLSGDYQMQAFAYSARLDPSLGFEAVSGDKDQQPRKVWDNADARTLLEKSMITSDGAERQTLFDQLHALFIADVPMIVTHNGVELAAFSSKVEGYRPWPAARPRLWMVGFKG